MHRVSHNNEPHSSPGQLKRQGFTKIWWIMIQIGEVAETVKCGKAIVGGVLSLQVNGG
jgi:hypothetical protein